MRLHSARPIVRCQLYKLVKRDKNSFIEQKNVATQTYALGINEFHNSAARLLNDFFHVDTSVRFILSKGPFGSLFSPEVPLHSVEVQDRTHSLSTLRRESTRSTSNERSWNVHFYRASTNKFTRVTIEALNELVDDNLLSTAAAASKRRVSSLDCVDARVYYSFPYRPCIKPRRKNRVQTFGIS